MLGDNAKLLVVAVCIVAAIILGSCWNDLVGGSYGGSDEPDRENRWGF